MTAKYTVFLISVFLLCWCSPSALASQYKITYDKTFTIEEFTYWHTGYPDAGPIFGEIAGPASVHVSLDLETDAASIIYYPAGSVFHLLGFDSTLQHELYGYAAGAISNLTATFGNKTWATDDLQTLDMGIGSAALWMDSPLIHGGTSDIVLRLIDADGEVTMGWMWMGAGRFDMYQDGRVHIMDYSSPYTLPGMGGVASIHDADSQVPEPASILLFGTGLGVLGLAVWKRRR